MTKVSCLALVAMTLVLCTTPPVGAKEWRGAGLAVGVISMDVGNINSTFKRHGIPELLDWRFCPIIGLYETRGKLTVDLSVFVVGAEVVESDTFKVKAGYLAGLSEAGYLFPLSESFSVRPLLGIGAANCSLEFVPRLSAVTFNSLLDNPSRTSKVSGNGLLIMVGLGAGYTMPLGKGHRAIRLDLKAGYMYSFQRVTWKLEDGAGLFKAPKFRPGGLYFSLGFSSGVKRK
ncbi:MAG: autotransporter outer membrane beta-barrel domain-containing protein [Candidatus Latescibacteria bacterium]|nr:autotransporter outer membrane beta-barrel domain-containing protein [Candidatus Latescibacterota bacterium]